MQNTENFNMDLDVSGSDFNTIVHAVAANENRKQFARRSIYTRESQANNNNGIEQSDGKYRLEKGFLGAHSDIGGGYESGDLSKSTFKQWLRVRFHIKPLNILLIRIGTHKANWEKYRDKH